MIADNNFSKRVAPFVECQTPHVDATGNQKYPVRIRLWPNDGNDGRKLALHLNKNEALSLAEQLIAGVRQLPN